MNGSTERSGGIATDLEFAKGEQTQKEVTVEIHLDPYTSTCEEGSIVEPSHLIQPVLRISFFKESKGDWILNRFSTALEFTFFMGGEMIELESHPDRFGWYQDELKVSFKCLLRNAVTVDSEGVGKSCQVIRGRDKSASSRDMAGKVGNGGATGRSLKPVSTDNSNDETEEGTLSTGFTMKLRGGPGQIGCSAFISDDYDIWDLKGRRDAFLLSGRMSDTLFKLNGDWRIWREGLCRYELMGMRTFIKKFNAGERGFVGKSRGKQIYEERVEQNICKVFEIDHSFSSFENLRSWQEWVVALYAFAPSPISDIIDSVSVSSCSSPGNRESGTVTVTQTPYFTVNSSTVHAATQATRPTPEMADMLEEDLRICDELDEVCAPIRENNLMFLREKIISQHGAYEVIGQKRPVILVGHWLGGLVTMTICNRLPKIKL
ncbi:hypothetical protein R1sor_016413 [Riccia sorocarpa]|uniref:Uncharacterized protein n=1 Tax=Riccia sorocarpa TaxID=122646 RepID=A0ABD3HI46_9MARC